MDLTVVTVPGPRKGPCFLYFFTLELPLNIHPGFQNGEVWGGWVNGGQSPQKLMCQVDDTPIDRYQPSCCILFQTVN